MHPTREAIPFVYCFGGGFFIAYAFPTFYIYFIEDKKHKGSGTMCY